MQRMQMYDLSSEKMAEKANIPHLIISQIIENKFILTQEYVDRIRPIINRFEVILEDKFFEGVYQPKDISKKELKKSVIKTISIFDDDKEIVILKVVRRSYYQGKKYSESKMAEGTEETRRNHIADYNKNKKK